MVQWRCPRCVQVISADDTVKLVDGGTAHFDYQRPRDPSPAERALLFQYYWEHGLESAPAEHWWHDVVLDVRRASTPPL